MVLWDGYSHRWPWTGLTEEDAPLWDWLNVVMLPIAFAVLPVWFHPKAQVTRRHKQVAVGALIAFFGLVAADT
jgi:hypothetical protein